jgi:hypothetical protein
MKNLTYQQLQKLIIGSTLVFQSRGDIRKSAQMHMKYDGSFEEKTYSRINNNEALISISTGIYEIISENNLGYIIVQYDNIVPSNDPTSIFHPNNKHSVHNNNIIVNGPYTIINSERTGKLLLYETEYHGALFLTVFNKV